jgi:hypothetical protein
VRCAAWFLADRVLNNKLFFVDSGWECPDLRTIVMAALFMACLVWFWLLPSKSQKLDQMVGFRKKIFLKADFLAVQN